MTANNELKTAIYSKLTESSDFNTAIGGRVYYVRATDSPTFPYCVFSFFFDEHSFDSGNEWEEVFIQFSLYDENSSNLPVGILESKLIDLLKDVVLSFTNFTQIDFRRTNKRYLLTDDSVWNTVLEYRIELEHN